MRYKLLLLLAFLSLLLFSCGSGIKSDSKNDPENNTDADTESVSDNDLDNNDDTPNDNDTDDSVPADDDPYDIDTDSNDPADIDPDDNDPGDNDPSDSDTGSNDLTDIDTDDNDPDDNDDTPNDNDTETELTREMKCENLPEHAVWNTVDKITQSWNGSSWQPSLIGDYNIDPSEEECRFKCDTNYEWNGSECDGKEQEADCPDKPANSLWNDNNMEGRFIQKWDGFDWIPTSLELVYDDIAAGPCRYKCDENHFEHDSECLNPCDSAPCGEIPDAISESCLTSSWQDYSCECQHDYIWRNNQCLPPLTLGEICTNQKTCYSDSILIDCPASSSNGFFGQDAQYAALSICTPQSFTVKTLSDKNIVRDNNTGLEWQQALDLGTWEYAINYCEKLNYAGYDSGWRLPTPQELLTIVDNNKYKIAVNIEIFPNMPRGETDNIWSSKSSSQNSAWRFNPYYGRIGTSSQTSSQHVMCVRGKTMKSASLGEPEKINGKFVVRDETSGLLWQKEYGTSLTWENALKYCQTLNDNNYANRNDWRLPNKNELASLLNSDKSAAPFSDFPDVPKALFWSSSNCLYGPEYAWQVHFGNGNVNFNNKSSSCNVRCVTQITD